MAGRGRGGSGPPAEADPHAPADAGLVAGRPALPPGWPQHLYALAGGRGYKGIPDPESRNPLYRGGYPKRAGRWL